MFWWIWTPVLADDNAKNFLTYLPEWCLKWYDMVIYHRGETNALWYTADGDKEFIYLPCCLGYDENVFRVSWKRSFCSFTLHPDMTHAQKKKKKKWRAIYANVCFCLANSVRYMHALLPVNSRQCKLLNRHSKHIKYSYSNEHQP